MSEHERLKVHLAEYQALKAEQTARIVIRETALYTTILVMSGISAIALGQTSVHTLLFLAIPPSAFTFFWVYLNNDSMISNLRKYFSGDLQSSILETLDPVVEGETVFHWEVFHRSIRRFRFVRRFINALVVFSAFFGSSLGAVVISYDAAMAAGGATQGIWEFDSILTVVMLVGILMSLDF